VPPISDDDDVTPPPNPGPPDSDEEEVTPPNPGPPDSDDEDDNGGGGNDGEGLLEDYPCMPRGSVNWGNQRFNGGQY